MSDPPRWLIGFKPERIAGHDVAVCSKCGADARVFLSAMSLNPTTYTLSVGCSRDYTHALNGIAVVRL